MAARINVSPDMLSLLKKIEKDGNVTKKYVMSTPNVSKTIKALMKHKFVVGVGSDYSTFEMTDLGRKLLALTPRYSGNTDTNGIPNEVWVVLVDEAAGTVENPKARVDMRSEPKKDTITDTRTLNEIQDKKESGFKSKFLASSASADSKRYYRAVAQALGGTLSSYEEGKEMKRIKIRTKDMNLEILQSWRRDGTPSKPVTILNFDDGSMNLGRFSIWAGKPEMYAEDIQNALSKHNKTEED